MKNLLARIHNFCYLTANNHHTLITVGTVALFSTIVVRAAFFGGATTISAGTSIMLLPLISYVFYLWMKSSVDNFFSEHWGCIEQPTEQLCDLKVNKEDIKGTDVYVSLHTTTYTNVTSTCHRLLTGEKGEPTSLPEVNHEGYSRKIVYLSRKGSGSTPDTLCSDNALDFVWGKVPFTVVTHLSLWDSEEGGTCLAIAPLDKEIFAREEDTVHFAPDSVNVNSDMLSHLKDVN